MKNIWAASIAVVALAAGAGGYYGLTHWNNSAGSPVAAPNPDPSQPAAPSADAQQPQSTEAAPQSAPQNASQSAPARQSTAENSDRDDSYGDDSYRNSADDDYPPDNSDDGNATLAFNYDSGGFCDLNGCPNDYWDYPVYDGAVYWQGVWYNGPLYYRHDPRGETQYWLRGGWRRDEWRSERPNWARQGQYRPALGFQFYLTNGFTIRDDVRRQWYRQHDPDFAQWDRFYDGDRNRWRQHYDDWQRGRGGNDNSDAWVERAQNRWHRPETGWKPGRDRAGWPNKPNGPVNPPPTNVNPGKPGGASGDWNKGGGHPGWGNGQGPNNPNGPFHKPPAGNPSGTTPPANVNPGKPGGPPTDANKDGDRRGWRGPGPNNPNGPFPKPPTNTNPDKPSGAALETNRNIRDPRQGRSGPPNGPGGMTNDLGNNKGSARLENPLRGNPNADRNGPINFKPEHKGPNDGPVIPGRPAAPPTVIAPPPKAVTPPVQIAPPPKPVAPTPPVQIAPPPRAVTPPPPPPQKPTESATPGNRSDAENGRGRRPGANDGDCRPAGGRSCR